MRRDIKKYPTVFVFLTVFVLLLSFVASAQGKESKTGERLVKELGCVVCHQIRGLPPFPVKAIPDLRREGEKVRPEWLFDFLRKPHALRPWLKVRMPNFLLTEREALAITLFISTQRKSQKQAAGGAPKRVPSKARLAEGKKLFDLFECAKCHPAGSAKTGEGEKNLAPNFSYAAQRLRPGWILQWLKNPQEFQAGTKMPNFFYDENEPLEKNADEKMRLITGYVLTLGSSKATPHFSAARSKFPDVGPKEGKELVRELNCAGCHQISGMSPPEKIAPNLSFAGSKFRRDWLAAFLQKPHRLRFAGYKLGWRSRMPNFRLTQKEVDGIVDYLMAFSFQEPMAKIEAVDFGRRQKFKGRKVFEKSYGCVGCHQIQSRGKVKGGISGPDLSKAGARLRPAFIYEFLKNPRAFEATGKMPVFGKYLSEKDARFLANYLGSMK